MLILKGLLLEPDEEQVLRYCILSLQYRLMQHVQICTMRVFNVYEYSISKYVNITFPYPFCMMHFV